MDRMLPDSFHDWWEGRHWRWVALLAGIVLTALILGLAAIVATLRGEDISPLAFLFVTLMLFVISIVGSGMLDGLVSRRSRDVPVQQVEMDDRSNRPIVSDADRASRDRRTIRSGLIALPAFIAFVSMLFW